FGVSRLAAVLLFVIRGSSRGNVNLSVGGLRQLPITVVSTGPIRQGIHFESAAERAAGTGFLQRLNGIRIIASDRRNRTNYFCHRVPHRPAMVVLMSTEPRYANFAIGLRFYDDRIASLQSH